MDDRFLKETPFSPPCQIHAHPSNSSIADFSLVYVSQMADRYVHDPHEVVRVGDVVDVKVIRVDKERGRIGLSMKL